MNNQQAEKLFRNGNKLKTFKRCNNKEYCNIVDNTNFLPDNALLKSRLWHIYNNVMYVVTCKMCNNPVKWDDTLKSTEQKYRKYCSHKCMGSDPTYKEKRLKTIKERYGDGLKEIVAKAKKTNMERYGVENAMKLEATKNKRNITCLKKYKVDNPAKVKEFMQKRKETNLTLYGYEHAAQSQQCADKARRTYIDKYNVEHISHRTLSAETISKLKNRSWLENEHHVNTKTVSKIANELGINISALCRYFHKYNITIKNFHQSTGEREIITFLESHNVTLCVGVRNIIKPYEIDIYLPDYKLGIEFNGNYWHSELAGKDKNYHINKTMLCDAKDIKLIHILESEWVLKPDIIKSRIINALGKNETIYARKCKIVPVSDNDKNIFLNNFHLQGTIGSKINIGLEYNGILVSVMTLGKPRFSKKYEFEMLRFASKSGLSVVGGASKLFKYFIKTTKPRTVVSYANLRYGKGDVYSNLGFIFSHNSKPNYSYFHESNTMKLYSRMKFQKHKLANILPEFDKNKTGWENMIEHGYNRIWDCGNAVWLWSR